jgi:hypothetical protein
MTDTGKSVWISGLYQTECCERQWAWDRGEKFPRCPDCHQPAVWRLLENHESKHRGRGA